MHSLKELGFEEYYYLDNERIYNAKKQSYVKEVGEYKYKLKNNEGKYKCITMKKIYRKLFNKVFCKDDIKLLKDEIFKEVEGTNGNYEVSNLGRIKSKANNHAIILKPQINRNGYERLQLSIEGQRYSKFVHSLVAVAWLKQPKNLEYEVHHIDGNKRNNKASNLEYLSKLEHRKKHNKLKRKES